MLGQNEWNIGRRIKCKRKHYGERNLHKMEKWVPVYRDLKKEGKRKGIRHYNEVITFRKFVTVMFYKL